MRLIDQFRRGMRRDPERAALVQGERAIDWREANDRVETMAAAMAAAGLGVGARIGVFSANHIDAFLVVLGIFRLGGIWVPVNARNSAEANRHWLDLSACEALFYHSSLEAEARALMPHLSGPHLTICIDRTAGANAIAPFLAQATSPAPEPPDDPDLIVNIFPTGGTTGLSKAACWTLRTWEALIGSFWQCLPSETAPIHLVAAPMTHAAGVLALCAMAEGATNIIIDRPAPDPIIDAIGRHGVTHLYLPPTAIYNLLDHPGAARSSRADRSSSPIISTIQPRPRRRGTKAGTAPAISGNSTRRASCRSSIARRTSSSRAASTFIRPRLNK